MVRHATLNSEDPSCHCGPARHTEHRGSQLIEENDEGEEGEEEEEEGGEETDIKSNNPHLTGGEKLYISWKKIRLMVQKSCTGLRERYIYKP